MDDKPNKNGDAYPTEYLGEWTVTCFGRYGHDEFDRCHGCREREPCRREQLQQAYRPVGSSSDIMRMMEMTTDELELRTIKRRFEQLRVSTVWVDPAVRDGEKNVVTVGERVDGKFRPSFRMALDDHDYQQIVRRFTRPPSIQHLPVFQQVLEDAVKSMELSMQQSLLPQNMLEEPNDVRLLGRCHEKVHMMKNYPIKPNELLPKDNLAEPGAQTNVPGQWTKVRTRLPARWEARAIFYPDDRAFQKRPSDARLQQCNTVVTVQKSREYPNGVWLELVPLPEDPPEEPTAPRAPLDDTPPELMVRLAGTLNLEPTGYMTWPGLIEFAVTEITNLTESNTQLRRANVELAQKLNVERRRANAAADDAGDARALLKQEMAETNTVIAELTVELKAAERMIRELKGRKR